MRYLTQKLCAKLIGRNYGGVKFKFPTGTLYVVLE